MTVRRPGRLLALVGVLGVALAAGCGDPDPPDAAPSGSPTSSATVSQSPSSEPTPTETSTAPTVAPATGPAIRLPSVTAAFPDGWRIVNRTKGSNSAGDTDPLTGGFFYVSDLKHLGSRDFDDIVANVLVHYENEKHPPVRGEDRVVDGVECWVIEGTHKGELVYEFGTLIGNHLVHFTFTYLHAPKDAMAIIDSVLASVQWQ